jgi:hypothetical protein
MRPTIVSKRWRGGVTLLALSGCIGEIGDDPGEAGTSGGPAPTSEVPSWAVT